MGFISFQAFSSPTTVIEQSVPVDEEFDIQIRQFIDNQPVQVDTVVVDSQSVPVNIVEIDEDGVNDIILVDDVSDITTTQSDITNEIFALQSFIDTNIVIHDSDQTNIERLIDESGFGDSFGIITTASLVDSNKNTITESDIFNVDTLPSALSVFDSSGNVLDSGGIVQVTFESISSASKSTTSWAVVNFYLDDTLLDTYSLWNSYYWKH